MDRVMEGQNNIHYITVRLKERATWNNEIGLVSHFVCDISRPWLVGEQCSGLCTVVLGLRTQQPCLVNAFSIPRFQSLDLDFSEFVSVSLLQLFSLSSLFPCGTYAFMLITSLHLSSHRPHNALITFAVSRSCLIDRHSFSVAEDTRK